MPKKSNGAVTSITIGKEGVTFFSTSDVHFDSVYCNRKAFFLDMDAALERNARIIITGDFFDAMNGRFDPRRDMSKVRPEYRRADYYDYLVIDAARKLEKYAANIAIISPGNHETAVLKNANTFLTDRLVMMLNEGAGNVIHGGYGGWIRILMVSNGKNYGSVKIKYFHGYGGEAPVTRGAIQTNRAAVFLPDADIVLNGHSHNAYWIPITRERISNKGELYFDTQYHVRTPGYCQAYGDGSGGWEVERGGVPKPLGGAFININDLSEAKAREFETISIEPVIHNPVPVSPVLDPFEGTVFPQE